MIPGFAFILYLVALVGLCRVDNLARLPFKLDNLGKIPAPIVELEADGQSMFAVVDTGAPLLFFVWKHWYESYSKKCEDFFYGCYECNPEPCKKGKTWVSTFDDGSKVRIFSHSGTVNMDGIGSFSLDFGLVAGFNKDLSKLWASLGLGRSTERVKPFKSVIDQLYDKNVTPSRSFSLYLNNGQDPSGEVLIGGKDSKKYVAPLQYVDMIDPDEGTVQLLTLGIGQDSKYRIKMVTPVDLDTGASCMYLKTEWKNQVISSLKVAGRKNVSITEEDGSFPVSCPDVAYLPSVTFFLQGSKGEQVAIEVPAEKFTYKTTEGRCFVRMKFTEYHASIGVTAFIGNYFYYDVDNNKVGIAKVKV